MACKKWHSLLFYLLYKNCFVHIRSMRRTVRSFIVCCAGDAFYYDAVIKNSVPAVYNGAFSLLSDIEDTIFDTCNRAWKYIQMVQTQDF